MDRVADRSIVSGIFMAACVVLLAAACDFHYRAAAEPATDEVAVQTISEVRGEYDHPARLSAQELTSILEEVRIEYKNHWLQRLITGELAPAPLFEDALLARVAPPLVEALGKAGARDRVVFYVAQRRSDDRRDVTSGALFVKGRSLTIVLANYRNRVDVVPGLAAYDRQAPETAVAPQRFSLGFARGEFVIEPQREAIDEVLRIAPPSLAVDYAQFLQYKSRTAAGR